MSAMPIPSCVWSPPLAYLGNRTDKGSRSQQRGDDGLPVGVQYVGTIGLLFTEPLDKVWHGET